TGAVEPMTDQLTLPNGLAFSPDGSVLYVVESAASRRAIYAFEVRDGGRALGDGKLFIDAEGGHPDGFRVDVDGNLWCGWGMGPGRDGVRVFNPDGVPIGHIDL